MKNIIQDGAGESATGVSLSRSGIERPAISVVGADEQLKSRRSTYSRRRQDVAQQGLLKCERRQLAQQIHDDLGAVLTGIKACICVAIARETQGGGVASRLLEDAAVLADSAFATIRKIGVDLRPVLLETLGLWAAIEWQARSLARRSGMSVTFYTDASLERHLFIDEYERVVYRVLSEAMINAEKHSKATGMVLRIYRHNGALVAIAEDNGVGAAAADLAGLASLGMIGMREQANELGACLNVDNLAGHGIRVSLVIPFEYTYVH